MARDDLGVDVPDRQLGRPVRLDVPVLAGRYELGPRLGLGGMAEVVRGHDRRLDRPVAIKLLRADRLDARARERFRRESTSSAGFVHPHAVTTFDAGESNGWLYLVMELVEGSTLAERLHHDGPLAPTVATSIAAAVLEALAAAHAVGLVHRDIKPGNILLGRNGTVKLADFGIAQRFDDVAHDLTGTGMFVGTAKYASPEQLAGKPATPASDVYSMGVVLFEMLAGHVPFDGDSAVSIAMAHERDPVPNVLALAPATSPAVAAAVAHALAKDPQARFASADQMRAALLDRPPPTARMPAPAVAPEPTERLATRQLGERPRQWWWWLLVLGLLVAGVAVAVAVLHDRSGPSAAPPTAVVPPATTVAVVPAPSPPHTTAAAPTTTVPAPTAAPPTAAPVTAPGSIAALIAALDATPAQFGRHANELRDALAKINDGHGKDAGKRAQQLLDKADHWVAAGELDPTTRNLLGTLLAPIAGAQQGDQGDQGD